MNIKFLIESGTAGYFNYDGCSYLISKQESSPVCPRVGEYVHLDTFKGWHRFVVTKIEHTYSKDNHLVTSAYIIPVDGSKWGDN